MNKFLRLIGCRRCPLCRRIHRDPSGIGLCHSCKWSRVQDAMLTARVALERIPLSSRASDGSYWSPRVEALRSGGFGAYVERLFEVATGERSEEEEVSYLDCYIDAWNEGKLPTESGVI